MKPDDNNFQVSLKEYFNLKIDDLKELFLRDSKEKETALKLQSVETERRLDALNGEAERITRILALSVPREVFEAFQKEIGGGLAQIKLDNTNLVTKDNLSSILKTPSDEIKGLTSFRDFSAGKASQTSVLISYFISILGIVIAILGFLLRK